MQNNYSYMQQIYDNLSDFEYNAPICIDCGEYKEDFKKNYCSQCLENIYLSDLK